MLKNENEQDIKKKKIKSPRNNTPDSNILGTKKNASFSKENYITLNDNKFSGIKKLSCKLMFDGTTGDDSKSKSSMGHKNKNKRSKKRTERKSESYKNKKKDKKKSVKMLKNERLKIPTGKRMSNNHDRIKLNLNNIDAIIKSSLPEKNKNNTRLDSYGNKINKENKKNVHIRFLDNIPSNKLIEIIPIESFKQLNIIEKIPKKKLISLCSECCQIF